MRDPLGKAIGDRIRAWRLRHGLTQRELAGRVAGGIDLSYVGKIERGEQLPSLKVLRRLGEVMGIPLRQFFEEAPATPQADEVDRLWREVWRLHPADRVLAVELLRLVNRHRRERAARRPVPRAAEPRRRYRRRPSNRPRRT